ncbi:MAG: Ig-like domain-containing protein [Clostridia bacterium]|nr:Ig-like domain-containing protein [Clostridia bacterium]
METMKKQAKKYLAALLACLMLLSLVTVVGATEPGEMILYTSSEDFEYGTRLASDAVAVEGREGVVARTSKDGKATIYIKHDAGGAFVQDTLYNDLGSGNCATLPNATANGGAFLEYDFNELITGQVTISFQATGGSGAGVNPRWEILDDVGNVVILGGVGNNANLGSDNNMECVGCANGTHTKGHIHEDGRVMSSDHMTGNGYVVSSTMGWYKMHLNFDAGTATFEQKADGVWKTYYGWSADATKSDPYVMALGSTRGAKTIRFNFSGTAAASQFVADSIEVNQTAFGQLKAGFDVENGGMLALGEPLKVNFNYPMDSSTLEGNITLMKNGAPVSVTFEPSATGVTVIPAGGLTAGNYTLTVGTGVQATGNVNPLNTEATVTFNVALKAPECFTSVENFNSQPNTATLSGDYYVMDGGNGTAKIKMKKDATATALTDTYSVSTGWTGEESGLKAKTSANGGAHMIYELNQALTGKVTLSFICYGGIPLNAYSPNKNQGPRWELLDDQGNAILVGATDGSANVGSTTAMACVTENCKGHYHTDGRPMTATHMYGNGLTYVNGRYKMHLDFDKGTVTFEYYDTTNKVWLPYYGWSAAAASSDIYTMSLGDAKNLKALKFNYNSSDGARYWVDAIDIAQTQHGSLQASFNVPATDVHPDQPLHINFNHAADVNALKNSGAITLTKQGESTPTAITILPSGDGTDVVVKPNASLTPGATYTLAVAGGTIPSTEAGIYPVATAASTTFTVGANVGYYVEENYNQLTEATNVDNSAQLLMTRDGNAILIGGGTAITNQSQIDGISDTELNATSGAFLTEDGRLRINRADASTLDYFVGIPRVSQGNLKVSFDVELTKAYGNSDNYFFLKNRATYGGDTAKYFRLGNAGSTGMYGSVPTDATKDYLVWGDPITTFGHGVETAVNHKTMQPGKYNVVFDCNLDAGTAVVTVKSTRSDGIWTGSVENVGPIVYHVSCPAVQQIGFSIPSGGETYIDNIAMRYTPPADGLMRVTDLKAYKTADANKAAITSIKALDEITISGYLTNDVRDDVNVEFYAAIYSNDDKLLKVFSGDAVEVKTSMNVSSWSGATKNVKVDLTVPADTPEGSYIKTFAWTTDLQPATEILNPIPKA